MEDGLDAVLVVGHQLVGHAVGHHDVRPAQLVLRRVHLLPEQLVQGLEAREDHRALDHLDVPLPQAVEVRADADAAARDVRQSEGLLVRPAGLAGNQAAALQALDADAAPRRRQVQAHDRVQHVPLLGARRHRVRPHGSLRQLRQVGIGDVQVLEPLHEVVRVHPRDLDQGLQLLDGAHPGPRVARNVNAGDAPAAGEGRSLLERGVLGRAEGPGLDRQIVADEDDVAASRVVGRTHGHEPHHHADGVLAAQLLLHQLVAFEHELGGREEILGDLVGAASPQPQLHEADAEQRREVVDVRGACVAHEAALAAALGLHRGPQHLDGVVRLLGLHVLPRDGAARRGVQLLLEGHGLPAHGAAGDEPQGRGRRGADPDLQLDLGDPELQHPRAVLRHALLHRRSEQDLDVLQVPIRRLRDRWQCVHKDLPGRLFLVQHRRNQEALDDVEGREEVFQERGLQRVQAHGDVRHAAGKHDLCLPVLRGPQVKREDTTVLKRRQRELVLDLRQLDEKRQCGAHVPVLGDLFPPACFLEVQVRRGAAHMAKRDVHHGAPLGVE
mmetsp:Transcript_90096/g.275896  ORF Transcript_90096/g.275896 Transcript_90096/m.275896 type:complete len:555 (+) Transcript_90096:1303-2967(+)